jgi:hypothetical protein
MKQAGVCTSTLVVSPDPLPPPTSTALKTPESTEEDSGNDPEPADEEDIQMKYSSD